MTITGSDNSFITLRDGPTVPTQLVLWMLACEDRGIRFHRAADGFLQLGPRSSVRPDDLVFAKQHRALLLKLVDYCDRLCEVPQ
jgi:hypothetical protein